MILILVSGIVVYLIAARYDILEKLVVFSSQHESWELDEFMTVSIYLMVAFLFFSLRRWNEISNRNIELQEAFSEIKQLKGFIPICASCKKIRDDEGYWKQVEEYISDHTDAKFTHSICSECVKKLYPELSED